MPLKLLGTILFYFFALGVAGYAVFAYGFMPLGDLVHPDMKLNFVIHPIGIYTHVFASLIALSLAPFQFSRRLRNARPRVHRAMGRTYLSVGVVVGGLAGLYMSIFAFGGVIAKLGFACLAVGWLYTGLRAYQAIRRGAVAEHRTWMIRNVSLTLAAVTLRIYLPSSMLAAIPFDVAYPVIAWLCWVPNLIVAELLFARTHMADAAPRSFHGAG
ncbi:MAG: DUF2306 domain-containing protein [Thermomonas sp.]